MSFESLAPALYRPTEMELEIVARVEESHNVISLVLRPADDSDVAPFQAGQHLVLRLADVPQRPVATYTISSAPHDRRGYRISVKLDAAGQGGSRYVHETAQVGTRLRVSGPRGSFVLAGDDRPVILLTGGIGITPALSMVHDLAQGPARPVYFIHACNNRSEHSFQDELREITRDRPWIRLFTAYTSGTAEDVDQGHCQHLGLVDRETLRRLLPLDHYRAYMCGPTGFMDAMRRTLIGLGVQDQDIRQESFGGALPASSAASPAAVPLAEPGDAAAGGIAVRFGRVGLEAAWDGGANLLDFAEAQGLSPDFSCRAGVCGSCQCSLLKGEVEYDEEPLDPLPEGMILLCCARPKGPIELDL